MKNIPHTSIQSQKGFTLIELIIVIVILSILSAFALPRFANLSREARIAVLDGSIGSVRAAAAIAHGKALVVLHTQGATNGLCGVNQVDLEGLCVNLVNMYPAVDAANINGIAAASQLSEDYDLDYGTAGQVTVRFAGVVGCEFTYVEAAANAMPIVTNRDITNC